jgi:hypothetical protein
MHNYITELKKLFEKQKRDAEREAEKELEREMRRDDRKSCERGQWF